MSIAAFVALHCLVCKSAAWRGLACARPSCCHQMTWMPPRGRSFTPSRDQVEEGQIAADVFGCREGYGRRVWGTQIRQDCRLAILDVAKAVSIGRSVGRSTRRAPRPSVAIGCEIGFTKRPASGRASTLAEARRASHHMSPVPSSRPGRSVRSESSDQARDGVWDSINTSSHRRL